MRPTLGEVTHSTAARRIVSLGQARPSLAPLPSMARAGAGSGERLSRAPITVHGLQDRTIPRTRHGTAAAARLSPDTVVARDFVAAKKPRIDKNRAASIPSTSTGQPRNFRVKHLHIRPHHGFHGDPGGEDSMTRTAPLKNTKNQPPHRHFCPKTISEDRDRLQGGRL